MEKVFIGNLTADVNEESLRKLLDQHAVSFHNVVMKRNFAFVTVHDKITVEEIVKKLNGKTDQHELVQV